MSTQHGTPQSSNAEDDVKKHPVVRFLATLLTGFLAGVGAFQFVVTYANQAIVSKDVTEQLATAKKNLAELQNSRATGKVPVLSGSYRVLQCSKIAGVATVRQEGTALHFTNERQPPDASQGEFFGTHRVRASTWNVIGAVTSDGDSIVWENDAVWRKY